MPENGTIVYSLMTGFSHLASGLCCGLSNLSAGVAIGHVAGASKEQHGYRHNWSLLPAAAADDEDPGGGVSSISYRNVHSASIESSSAGYCAMGVAFMFGFIGFVMALVLSQNQFVCEG